MTSTTGAKFKLNPRESSSIARGDTSRKVSSGSSSPISCALLISTKPYFEFRRFTRPPSASTATKISLRVSLFKSSINFSVCCGFRIFLGKLFDGISRSKSITPPISYSLISFTILEEPPTSVPLKPTIIISPIILSRVGAPCAAAVEVSSPEISSCAEAAAFSFPHEENMEPKTTVTHKARRSGIIRYSFSLFNLIFKDPFKNKNIYISIINNRMSSGVILTIVFFSYLSLLY